MALSRRMWGAGKLLVIVTGLAVTFLVFFAIAMRVALKAREVAVPSLVGRAVNDATAVLTDLGLTLRLEEPPRADPKVPRGRVLTQEPPPGVVTRRSRSVRVWLSAGPAVTIVPELVGESERTALLRAEGEALTVNRISEIRSSDYPPGLVVAQWPPPNARAVSVTLLVNRGEAGRRYVMPDLIGTRADQAASALRARCFRVAIVGEQPYPGIAPGTVIRQQPTAGFQIAAGESISLEASR
jgi:serine/threonine-protein kinase